jgi:hypothetical protein
MGVVDEGGSEKRKHLHISLLHNPSHLELIGAVAAGKARAKNDGGSKALCLQVGVRRSLAHSLCFQCKEATWHRANIIPAWVMDI